MTNIITELRSTVNTHHANVAAAQAEADKFQRDFANYYAQDVFARKCRNTLESVTQQSVQAMRQSRQP